MTESAFRELQRRAVRVTVVGARGDRVHVEADCGRSCTLVWVPREWVQVLDMSVEEAMRSSLTAWMGSAKNPSDAS